ncbi:MAG: ABC transporter substrate-binding protein [Armatimonadota bacterium]
MIRSRNAGVPQGLLWALALGLVLVVAASGAPTGGFGVAQAQSPGKPLVITVTTEPSTLDPQAGNDRHSRVLTGNVFETLLDRDRNGRIVPMLAESYEATNQTTWRFKLRRGVKFHNGTPFTAQAAAYSINRIINPDYRTQRTSYIIDIAGARAVDENTVDILTKGINAVLPIQVTSISIVPPALADAREFAWRPVGTGPYRFLGWIRGREMKLQAHEGYWGAKPAIKDIVVRIIPDKQTELAALQAGEVDLVLDLLPEQTNLAPRFLSAPATEFSYIAFNTFKRELSDPRVRIAMNLAIDKDKLAKTIYGGHARPNNSQNLSEGMVGYNSTLRPFAYDPARARALLVEAGYPNGFQITLHTPIGRYLKGEETSEYVAQQLGEVGIRTRVQLHEWNAYRTLGRIPGDRPSAFDLKYGWNSNEWFDASRIDAHIVCGGASSKICDRRIDDLMDRATKTLDQRVRAEMYQQVWAILTENPYSIYLLQQNLIYGMARRLTWRPRLDDEVRVVDMRLTP